MTTIKMRACYLAAAVGAMLLWCRAAAAQTESSTLAGAESPAMAELNPETVPGREKGDRTRAEESPAIEPDAPDEPRDWFGHKPYWKWNYATGDWGGARTWLEDRGLSVNGSVMYEWSSVWSGGVRNVASTRSLLDLNATLDAEKMMGWTGATLFADFYSSDVRGGSRDVGDFQGVSGYETGVNVHQLAELWLEQKFWSGVVRAKAGKIEALSEFAFVNAAAEFVHTSAGYIQTNSIIPTYPNPANGVVLFAYPHERVYIGLGAFDGSLSAGVNTGRLGIDPTLHGSEWFSIAEAGVTWEFDALGEGRVAAGAWHHTGSFARFDGNPNEQSTNGFYALAEQQVWRRGGVEGGADEVEDGDEESRGLFVFAQFGYTDDAVASVGTHLGVGVSLLGSCSARPDDAAGLYYSHIDLSDHPNAGFPRDESAFEAFYKVQFTPFASVKPFIQFIVNPSGDPGIEDAVVGGVRVEVAF